MRRLFTILFSLVFVMNWTAPRTRAYSLHYVSSESTGVMKWPDKAIEIAISSSLNSPPSNIKEGSDVLGALRRALARWSDVANVRFVQLSSDRQSISPAGNGDEVSLITVADTFENRAVFEDDERTGRTRVFYDPATGVINEADVIINPAAQFSTDGTTGTYDLEATFTHEIGHVLGLEHSNEVGSIMQPSQGINGLYQQTALSARALSDDDIAGIRALYEGEERFGTITGQLRDQDGQPTASHVWAEDMKTGKLVAGSMSAPDGSYLLEGLPVGEYRLVAERDINEPVAVRLSRGRVVRRDVELRSATSTIKPTLFGRNGHLSTIAIPLERNQRARIFVAGEGVDRIAGDGIYVTSPLIKVNPASLTLQSGVDYEHPVISFDVEIGGDVHPGDYTIRFRGETGEIAYIPGALTIAAEVSEAPSDEPTQPRTALVEAVGLVGALVRAYLNP